MLGHQDTLAFHPGYNAMGADAKPASNAPATIPTVVPTEAEEIDELLARPTEQTNDNGHTIDNSHTEEDTIDASDPLFATRNDGMEDGFVTQDIDNIRNLAANFATPSSQNRDLQSNYKFRKRSPLK